MRWLAQEYPQLVEGYTHLYARKYAPSDYRKEVSSVIGMLKAKYGLRSRAESDADAGRPEQEKAGEPPALPLTPDPVRLRLRPGRSKRPVGGLRPQA